MRKTYEKKIKSLLRGRALVLFLGFFFTTLVLLLCIEYHRLKDVSAELLDLKEDYRVYTIALKKALDERVGTENQAEFEGADEKKKLKAAAESDESRSEVPFMVVNRDEEYLLANALAFAKEEGLENAVAQLFDVTEWEKRVRPHLQPKKSKRFVGVSARIRQTIKPSSRVNDFVFSWPIDQSKFWLSSLFGPRKMKDRGTRYHYGIDMAAHKGTPVKAAATGIVLESYWNNGYGNCIIIAHNRKYKTRYAHLNTRRVKIGQKVKRGEVIGTVGDTGLVRKSGNDASHLHFEVYAFGRHINPLSVLL